MGTFTHEITLLDSSGDGQEMVEALVDTGASFSIFPAPVLERLGVVPHRTVSLRLANGQRQQWSIGHVGAELDGVEETIICAFGEPESPAVIGDHTLQAFLLAVDTVEERLVPAEGYF